MNRLHAFYISKPWRELSYTLKINAGGRCGRCGTIATDFKYLIGHHTIPLTEENICVPEISLNEKYIEVICLDCHNKEHKRFGYNERAVYVVWGSPLSGKTTAVRELLRRGDIVVDIDELWAALTLLPKYVKPNNVRFNVFAVRDNLLDQIKTRYGQWNDAYVITSDINRNEVEKLAARLGGELLFIEASRQECLSRVIADERPEEWAGFVNAWFDANEGACRS